MRTCWRPRSGWSGGKRARLVDMYALYLLFLVFLFSFETPCRNAFRIPSLNGIVAFVVRDTHFGLAQLLHSALR